MHNQHPAIAMNNHSLESEYIKIIRNLKKCETADLDFIITLDSAPAEHRKEHRSMGSIFFPRRTRFLKISLIWRGREHRVMAT